VNRPRRTSLGALAAAACVLASATGRAGPGDDSGARDQPADSLIASIEHLEPADQAVALAWLDDEPASAGAVGEASGRWRGGLRTTATGARWDLGRRDGRGELRLRGGDRTATSGGVAWRAGGAGVLVGDLALHAGSGLLLSGAGRWAGLSTPGGDQGGVRAGLHAGTAERRALRGGIATLRAGPGELFAWRGRARDAGAATRSGAALACVGARGRATLVVATEAAGRGGSLSAAWTSGGLSLSGESSVWAAQADGSRRTAWAVAGRWRAARRATVEAQVAAVQPGPSPAAGQRPAALTDADGRGWLLRLQRRGRAVALTAAMGAAEHDGWSEGSPRLTAVRRWSLELESREVESPDAAGGGTRRRWGASLSGRSQTQRGWAGRMPWLPPARQAVQDTWRAAAWVEAGTGDWRGRLGWRTVRVHERGVEPAAADDRSALSLSVGASPTAGWGWRFIQVWAWGGEADLLSVETPAPGLVLPRHWGRWQDERTLGVHWRRGGVAAAAAAACRRPRASGEAAAYEFRATAALAWRGW